MANNRTTYADYVKCDFDLEVILLYTMTSTPIIFDLNAPQ